MLKKQDAWQWKEKTQGLQTCFSKVKLFFFTKELKKTQNTSAMVKEIGLPHIYIQYITALQRQKTLTR